MRTITTFDEVKARGSRYETIDGKRRLRRKTFYETINPFNRNSDGTIKTRADCIASVVAKARAWEAESV